MGSSQLNLTVIRLGSSRHSGQIKALFFTSGDQIVPPSRLRQMMLKRKRLEEEDFAEFDDYENGFDNHHLQV